MRTEKAAWIGSLLFAGLLMLALARPQGWGVGGGDSSGAPWGRSLVKRDLPAIKRDTLRVLVLPDPLSYDPASRTTAGLEWEILEGFAVHSGIPITAVPVSHPDSMLMMLQDGRGDVIAAQLAPEGHARRFIAFSIPYRSVVPIRCQLNSDPLVRATWKHKRKPGMVDTLFVSHWSPFLGLGDALDSNLRMTTLVVDSALPEELLVKAALGQRRSILISDATGTLEARRLPHLAFAPRMGRRVPLAFGLRRDSRKLKRALDEHLSTEERRGAIDELVDSYTNGQLTKGALRTLPDLELEGDSISPFDSLFRINADATGMEWHLFAAMAFKETRFDSSATSFAGADGLMQMMPATAAAMGVDATEGVAGHVRGATSYIADLDTLWGGSVPDREQRLKFALASYNAGPGHIKDAQRLAGRLGLDPKRWDGNVERAVLLLAKPAFFNLPEVRNGYCRGHETFWYVRDVIAAFGQYRRSMR